MVNKFVAVLAVSFMLFFAINIQAQNGKGNDMPYQGKSDWSALTNHEIPEWFKDAKLGIYAHLGVYSVPAHANEWYAHNMYATDSAGNPKEIMKYHIKKYGPLNKFGYKDFIPMFKAEKFDAKEWAELFKKSGAKFAGIVTEHHDGFAMWNSKINPFNAVDMGPHQNLYGNIVKELRKENIKILATFHHALTYNYYFSKENIGDLGDTAAKYLYGRISKQEGDQRWFGQIKEVIDEYQPDQIWFDFDLKGVADSMKNKFATYYYGKEKEWNKQVIITRKYNQLPEGVGVLDVERGGKNKPEERLWQTDDALAVGSWTWTENMTLKPSYEIIHELVDIVSKNGVLLLNVCPKANGTIPDDQRKILADLGNFLSVNGDAIYATRPYKVHGEGPHLFDEGRGLHNPKDATKFTAEDIRFTKSKDGKKIYIIALGWPKDQLMVTALKDEVNSKQIKSVKLLGTKAKADCKMAEGNIIINTAKTKQPFGQYAFAWEVQLK